MVAGDHRGYCSPPRVYLARSHHPLSDDRLSNLDVAYLIGLGRFAVERRQQGCAFESTCCGSYDKTHSTGKPPRFTSIVGWKPGHLRLQTAWKGLGPVITSGERLRRLSRRQGQIWR